MKIKAFLAALALGAGLVALPAAAAAPTYQINQNGSTAQVTVWSSDAGAPVVLYYNANGGSTGTVGTIGTTNSNGYFYMSISSSTYSIPSGALTYVTVNGVPSAVTQWPYWNGSGTGSVQLSQTNASMSVGQNASVTISGGTGSYYILTNSNSGIVNATITGSVMNLYANAQGSTTITVCSNGIAYSGSTCASIFVSVGSGSNGALQLSQTNVALATGQVTLITAQASSATNLFVSSNSNPNVVTASASGNGIYLTAVAPGSATIMICNNIGFSMCGTVSVSVYYKYGPVGSRSLTLAQNSVTVSVGQSQSVAIYGSGNFYISSNSNQNAVSASIVNNNQIYIQGVNPGSATISVCSNQYGAWSNSCATLYVTSNSPYGYTGYNYGNYSGYYGQQAPTQYSYPNSYSASNGVYLSQVPYTGLADDFKAFAFVAGLVAFSALGAYFIVGKKVLA